MPGVARVDHRTKCVSLVAITLSQNFETRNWPVCSGILNVSLSVSPHTPQYTRTTIRAPSHILFKYTLGTDPKENTTSERTPKKIPAHCCRYQETDRYEETDLELIKKKTPPLHSNSPSSPSNTHTKVQRKVESQPASPFRFYIYRLKWRICEERALSVDITFTMRL
jgi:hypothetical protein